MMLVYILVAFYPLMIGELYERNILKRTSPEAMAEHLYLKRRFHWLLLAAVPMFFLIAFRGENMGADAGMYQQFFTKATNNSWDNLFDNTRMESGFLIFMKLISYITDNILIYQIFYTAIYLLVIVDFANRLEKGNFLFLYFFGTLGLYTFMFTGVRQCLAMCICLFSYKFVKSRKFIPFVLLVALAFFFHKSAVIFVLVYFIFGIKLNAIITIIYLAMGAFGYLNIETIQSWFNDQLGYDYGVEYTGNGIIFLLVMVVITVFSMMRILKSKRSSKFSYALVNINLITLLCWILRLVSRVAERPSYYFMFFSIAMLGYAVCHTDSQKELTTIKLIVCSLTMLLLVYRLSTNLSRLIPYQFYS